MKSPVLSSRQSPVQLQKRRGRPPKHVKQPSKQVDSGSGSGRDRAADGVDHPEDMDSDNREDDEEQEMKDDEDEQEDENDMEEEEEDGQVPTVACIIKKLEFSTPAVKPVVVVVRNKDSHKTSVLKTKYPRPRK